MDIRAQRTRKMLVAAFDELVEQKQLEKITVSELCELSTVRRATFYRHFSDMQDFIRYYFTTLTERFLSELAEEAQADGPLDELMPYARSMHAKMLACVDGHRALFRHVMGNSMLADTMDMVVVQVADGIVSRINAGIEEGAYAPEATAESISLYYAAGMVHSMRWWVLDERPAPVGEVVENGMAILESMLRQGPGRIAPSRYHASRPRSL